MGAVVSTVGGGLLGFLVGGPAGAAIGAGLGANLDMANAYNRERQREQERQATNTLLQSIQRITPITPTPPPSFEQLKEKAVEKTEEAFEGVGISQLLQAFSQRQRALNNGNYINLYNRKKFVPWEKLIRIAMMDRRYG